MGSRVNFANHIRQYDLNGRFEVTKNRIDVDGLTRNEDAWCYRDVGAGAIGDFTVRFETELTAAALTSSWTTWAVSNDIDDEKAWQNDAPEAIGLLWYNLAGEFKMLLLEYEEYDYEWSTALVRDVVYFVEAVRSGTSLTVYIRTGSHTGTLVDTLSVDVPTGRTYQYEFFANSSNNGNSYAATGYSQNYTYTANGVTTEPLDAYVLKDENGRYTTTDYGVVVTGLTNDIAHIYKDYGADYFDTFTHRFDFQVNSVVDSVVWYPWAVANSVTHGGAWGGTDAVAVYWYAERIGLANYKSPSYDTWLGPSTGVRYYVTVKRVGATVTAYIRTGSHYGTLEATLTVTLPVSAMKYQYLFVSNSHTSYAGSISGSSANYYFDGFPKILLKNPSGQQKIILLR